MNNPFLALVVTLAIAPAARASELTYRTQLQSNAPAAQSSFVLPRFDPGVGALQRVRIDLQLDVQGLLGLENLAVQPSMASVDLFEALRMQLPGDPNPTSVELQASGAFFMAAFDGTLDYGGASGASVPAQLAGHRHVELVTGLDHFTATTLNTTVDLGLELVGQLAFGPDTAGRADLAYTGSVQVTYEYEPRYPGRPRRIASAVSAPAPRLQCVDPRSLARCA